MSSSWEVPEIEKQKGISVCIQVKKDPILLQESEPKVENGKELEEEDDQSIFKLLTL